MHTFGGLTPQVIDDMSISDFRILVKWAEALNKKG